jgi:hypothetical protein
MPYKDPSKQANYRRMYLADPAKKAKHKATKDKNRRQNSTKRKEILSRFPCVLCAESDPDLIDWHHVYPEDKVFDIKGSLSQAYTTWWDEVIKCIPVCALCHRKIHKDKLCLIPQKKR